MISEENTRNSLFRVEAAGRSAPAPMPCRLGLGSCYGLHECAHYFAASLPPPLTARQATNFSSEGFDLDALGDDGVKSSGDSNADAICELGGGATVAARDEPHATTAAADSSTTEADAAAVEAADADGPPDPLAKSEASKAEGNASFKAGDCLDAHDSCTDAIEACPGEPTGEQLLKMREEFEEAEREKAAQRHREEIFESCATRERT